MLSYVIAVAVTLVISIPVTFAVTSAYRKKETETKIGNAEDKAREIIDDAVKTAESKKREGLLENPFVPKTNWIRRSRNAGLKCSATKEECSRRKKTWTRSRMPSRRRNPCWQQGKRK